MFGNKVLINKLDLDLFKLKEQFKNQIVVKDLDDLRDEFIKEICVDNSLDPNCSIVRNISPTSYQDTGDMLALAINYRMEVAGDNGKLELFFENPGFAQKISLGSILDGDILQLLSTNNETGIEGFDLENPRYIGYQFNHLDPEVYPDFFKVNRAEVSVIFSRSLALIGSSRIIIASKT